jgi:hypothetical protein
MANFILLVALLAGGLSFVAANTPSLNSDGLIWLTDVCSTAGPVCSEPHQLAYVASGLGGLGIVMKVVSALRN